MKARKAEQEASLAAAAEQFRLDEEVGYAPEEGPGLMQRITDFILPGGTQSQDPGRPIVTDAGLGGGTVAAEGNQPLEQGFDPTAIEQAFSGVAPIAGIPQEMQGQPTGVLEAQPQPRTPEELLVQPDVVPQGEELPIGLGSAGPEASIGPSDDPHGTMMAMQEARSHEERAAIQEFRDQIPIKQQIDIVRTGLRNAPGVLGSLARVLREDSDIEELLESGLVELSGPEKGLELAATFSPVLLEVLATKQGARFLAGKTTGTAKKALDVVGRSTAGTRGGRIATGAAEGLPTDIAIGLEEEDVGQTGIGVGLGGLLGGIIPGGRAAARVLDDVPAPKPKPTRKAAVKLDDGSVVELKGPAHGHADGIPSLSDDVQARLDTQGFVEPDGTFRVGTGTVENPKFAPEEGGRRVEGAERRTTDGPVPEGGERRVFNRREILRREINELKQDKLTGVLNQSQYKKAAKALDADDTVELVQFDATNFKALNDITGEKAGDEFLAAVGQVLRDSGVPSRRIFRAGGDEFAVAVAKGEGEKVAAAVKKAVDDLGFEVQGQPIGLRSGVGRTAEEASVATQAAKKLEADRPVYNRATKSFDPPEGKAPPVEKAPADTGKPKARPAKAAEPEVAPPPKRTPEQQAKIKKQKERVAEKQPKKMADVKKPRRQAAAEQTDLFEASAKEAAEEVAGLKGALSSSRKVKTAVRVAAGEGGVGAASGGLLAAPAVVFDEQDDSMTSFLGRVMFGALYGVAAQQGLTRLPKALADSNVPFVADWFRKGFTAGGRLPGYARRYGQKEAHEAAKILTNAQGIVSRFSSKIGRTHADLASLRRGGKGRIRALNDPQSNPLAGFTKSEQAAMDRWLRSDWDAPMDGVPKDAQDILKRMRREMDGAQKEIVGLGLFDESFEAAIKEGHGIYLYRTYRKHDYPDWAAVAPDVLGKEEWDRVLGEFQTFIRGTVSKRNLKNEMANAARRHHKLSPAKFRAAMEREFPGTFPGRSKRVRARAWKRYQTIGSKLKKDLDIVDLSDEGMAKIVQQYMELPASSNALRAMGNGSLGKLNTRLLAKRNHAIPEQIRNLWGEVKDPWVNYVRTMHKQAEIIANGQLLTDTWAHGLEGGWIKKSAGMGQEGRPLVQIPEDSITYGPMAGHWVEPEFMRAMDAHFKVGRDNPLYAFLAKANAYTKEALTVQSIGTQFRNVWGNLGQLAASGVTPAQITKYAKSSGKDLLEAAGWKGSKGDKDAWLSIMQDYGIIGDNARAAEIEVAAGAGSGQKSLRMFEHAAQQEGYLRELEEGVKLGKKVARPLQTARGVAKTLYRFGDDYFKIVAFNAHLDDIVRETGRARDSIEVVRDAAERTVNRMATFSKTPTAISNLSKVGAFPAFASEMIRTTRNTLEFISKGLKDSNPEVRYTAWKSALGITSAMGATTAAGMATKWAFNVSDDQDRAIRRLGMPWSEDSTMLYTPVKDGVTHVFDLNYLAPHAFMAEGLAAIMRGEDWEEVAKTSITSTLGPFVQGAPIASNFMKVAGSGVAPSQKTVGGIVGGALGIGSRKNPYLENLRWLGVPATVETLVRLSTTRSRSSRELNRLGEALGAVGLAKPVKIDARESLKFKAFTFKEEMQLERRPLNRAKATGVTSRFGGDDFEGLEMDVEERQNILKEDFADVVRAMGDLGVPDWETKKILSTPIADGGAGLSKKLVNELFRMRGSAGNER
jgi:diguanylate cyclase (GGDEF)-like protein